MTIPKTRFTASGGDLNTPLIGYNNLKNSSTVNATVRPDGGLQSDAYEPGGQVANVANASSRGSSATAPANPNGGGATARPITPAIIPSDKSPKGSPGPNTSLGGGGSGPSPEPSTNTEDGYGGTGGGLPGSGQWRGGGNAATPAVAPNGGSGGFTPFGPATSSSAPELEVIDTFGRQTDKLKENSGWYDTVKADLLFATTVSTVDGLATNTVVHADSIGTINNMMGSLFTGLKLPPTVKSGYHALSDINKIKLLQSIVESSPDGFSRAMVNYPFYDGSGFLKDVSTSPEFSERDRDQVREDLMAGIISFSYSKGQRGVINAINTNDFSERLKVGVLSTVAGNAIKSGNTPALSDCMGNVDPSILAHAADEIASKMSLLDCNPDGLDRTGAAMIAVAITNCDPAPENLMHVGRWVGDDYEDVADGRPPKGTSKDITVNELTTGGWNTALVAMAAANSPRRGNRLTETFTPEYEEFQDYARRNNYADLMITK